jgi:DNA repair protein RecN (Recombination protein N)
MLLTLCIRNLAVAKNVTVELERSLNIITGETGAGKSVLVDALSLLKGARAEVSSIRDGCDFAEVSGQFKIGVQSKIWATLEDQGIPKNEEDPDVVHMKRVFFRNQKSKCFVNETAVSQKVLSAVSNDLIDISSQFENQKLLDPDSHTRYLDQYALCTEIYVNYHREYSKVQTLDRRIREIQAHSSKRSREIDFLKFELSEIEAAKISVEEWSRIEEKLKLGAKSQQISNLCVEMNEALSEASPSCLSVLKNLEKMGEKLKRICPPNLLSFQAEKLSAAKELLSDLSFDLHQTQKAVEIDESEYAHILERSEIYNRLFQKHGPNPEHIINHASTCRNELDNEVKWEEELLQCLGELTVSVRKSLVFAKQLTQLRTQSLKKLSLEIERELADLGMPKAKFVCRLMSETQVEAAEKDLGSAVSLSQLAADEKSQYAKLGRFGESMVRFYLSANPGLEPQPIERVASGGELSRMMLAIKAVLIDPDSLNLFVFDEIDTGISGAIASKVGRKLAQFCKKRQAICITHLPQVACFAHAHFVVTKSVVEGVTSTQIKKANLNDRYHELATMVSGQNLTPESIVHAKSLIKEAKAEASF